jgi:hypothetical protein
MTHSTAVQERNTASQLAGEQAIQAMVRRSTTDRAFRDQLLTNPRAAIATFVGKPEHEIPAELDFAVVESHATATIVLPDPVNAELSDSELETVAGGSDPVTIAACIMLGIFIIDEGIKISQAN